MTLSIVPIDGNDQKHPQWICQRTREDVTVPQRWPTQRVSASRMLLIVNGGEVWKNMRGSRRLAQSTGDGERLRPDLSVEHGGRGRCRAFRPSRNPQLPCGCRCDAAGSHPIDHWPTAGRVFSEEPLRSLHNPIPGHRRS